MNDDYIRILPTELHKQGYPQAEYLPEEKILKLNPNCSALYIKWDKDGELLISSCRRDSSCSNKVLSVVRQTTTLSCAWAIAEPMPFHGVFHFRKLAEWNNIVLAARDDRERGLWEPVPLTFATVFIYTLHPHYTSVGFDFYCLLSHSTT